MGDDLSMGSTQGNQPDTAPGVLTGDAVSNGVTSGAGPARRRDQAAALLAKPVLRSLARRLPRWRGLIVLNYHRIGERAGEPWDRTLWNVSAETFDRQLEHLARNAEVVAPEDVIGLARERRRGRHVLVTFDDGYRDNYEIAFPLLTRHGVRAAFFPTVGFLDGALGAWWDELAWMVRRATADSLPPGEWATRALPLGPEQDATIAVLVAHYKALEGEQTDRLLERIAAASGAGRPSRAESAEQWMTWDMVRELHSAGMAIGGHTVTHPILARRSSAQQEHEIATAAERLAQELGHPMRWFAYPVGSRDSYDAGTQRILAEHGVELAFAFEGGFASFASWKPFEVPRVHVSVEHGPDLLQAMLTVPQLFTRS
jgi:peptidoglycan/xylan/chitin deacetylase (PgdA/CDA1 family)